MRDLSLNAISFHSAIAIAVAQVFNFRDPTLEAVAVVVFCDKREALYPVHAKLLSVAFVYKTGVFVSSSV